VKKYLLFSHLRKHQLKRQTTNGLINLQIYCLFLLLHKCRFFT
jgi:hypothetical protein